MNPNPPTQAGNRNSGCAWLIKLTLLGVAYLIFSPASPGHNSFLVDANQRIYLETEVNIHGEGFLDPQSTYTLDVYYVRLGGWFSWTKRRYYSGVATSEPTGAGGKLENLQPHYSRSGPGPRDPISVSCASCLGGVLVRPPEQFPTDE